MCTGPAFGDPGTTGDLLTRAPDLRKLRGEPVMPAGTPCPHGAPPVIGAPAHVAHRKEPRAGGNDNGGHNTPSTSMVSKLIAAWHSDMPISFQDLGDTDGPRGTKAGQHQLSAHSQQHISKLILKSLLDNTSNPSYHNQPQAPCRMAARTRRPRSPSRCGTATT
jgi:hypothetical protein